MTITATELKENLGKYLALSQSEDILVKKNGKVIVKITGLENDKVHFLNEFAGSIKDKSLNYTKDEIKEMRLKEKCEY